MPYSAGQVEVRTGRGGYGERLSFSFHCKQRSHTSFEEGRPCHVKDLSKRILHGALHPFRRIISQSIECHRIKIEIQSRESDRSLSEQN